MAGQHLSILDLKSRMAPRMAFRTAGGSVSAEGRRAAEAKGQTMPGGKFTIRNADDLENAKHEVGRASNPAAARRWINKRAKELGEPGLGESKEGKKKTRREALYT